MEPLVIFLLVVIIGIAVGLLFHTVGRGGWLTRQIAGGRAGLTAALVGIAGAFLGFHIFALAGVIAPLLVLLGAVLGALVVVWAWRSIKL